MKKSTNLTTGAVDDTVKNHLRTAYNVEAVPRLIADWNLNRYSVPVATNTPSEDTDGFDIEAFPISSIVEPLRPSKGAAKALINQATISPGYMKASDARFYVSDVDDTYKYWVSPYPANAAGTFANHTDGVTTARPRVTYDKMLKSNKIVIKLENTWASPKNYTIHIASTVGGAFGAAIAGSNPPIANDGTITLYYNGTAWVSTRPATPVVTSVAAIEFRVTSMGPGVKKDGSIMQYKVRGQQAWVPTTGARSNLQVIAMEAHFEADLTNRLISVDDTFDMADKSQLYPIGTITSNVANVVLSNEDGLLNVENPDPNSPYTGLIEPNAEFNLEYIYNINGTKYSVQQFKMYSAEWSGSDGQSTVSLEDYSKYLKEKKTGKFLVEGKRTTEIVWRVLDSVGFSNYEIQEDDLLPNNVIPIFWVNGDLTVWEVLNELANATQTAIYMDSRGILQVRTREAAFKDTQIMDWRLLGQKEGGSNLPDIKSWSPSSEYEANKISVKYKTTKWKVNSAGDNALQTVWEPEGDTMVVRSSQLFRSITNASTHIYLEQKESLLWPFKSKVQIDGEIIQYEGKQFVYYTYTNQTQADGTTKYVNEKKNIANPKSSDEFTKLNLLTPKEYQFKNYYTGALLITDRGAWNTSQINHTIDINGWSTKYELRTKTTGVQATNVKGFKQNRKESTVTINTPPVMKDANDTFYAQQGSSAYNSYTSVGTRFKFNNDKASPTQMGGLAYQMSGSREDGYYVEVRLSSGLGATERNATNEVNIYSQKGGKKILIGKGSATAIAVDIWYDLDVYHSGSGNVQTIAAFINGQQVARGVTTAANQQGPSSKISLFARGKTNMDFEYVYAIAQPVAEPPDNYGFFDLKYGGIRGGQWEREYVWDMRTRTTKLKKKNSTKNKLVRYNKYFFDEFGPYVHEVREFDVTFDPVPVRYSYLFNTNEWFTAVPEYSSNPFGAKFIIANAGRIHAVVKGEDSLLYAGAGSAVNQVCVVLGQPLDISDEESVERKNEAAIRARGEIESELSSDWIQSVDMANDLANWMRNHWSDSVDEVEVEVFGNPLLEIGDVVDVLYDKENLSPSTHKYFVVGTSSQFGTEASSGIETKITLRRRRYVPTV